MRNDAVIMVLGVAVCIAAAQTAPHTQPAAPARLQSLRAPGDHVPTADPADAFWKDVPAARVTRSVLGQEMTGRHLDAQVQSRWTADHVYFLFSCDYEKLTLNDHPDTTRETPRLWNTDVVELYLGASDPAQPPTRYRELQMSPHGEFLDNDIDATRPRPGFNGEDQWNSGFVVKARIDEKDRRWFGEMKIPWSAIESAARLPVKPGQEFRMNIYRQDGAGRTPDGRNARTFMAWQPPGVWNPHHPEVFGILELGERPN
jgi:hypothetical protein